MTGVTPLIMVRTIEIDRQGDVLLQFPAEDTCPSSASGGGGAFGTLKILDQSTGQMVDAAPPLSAAASTGRGTNLLVSSAVLSLISPVFANMFSPASCFAEATAFRAEGSPRPFPISLPEDSAEAFTVLANVAHHRAETIPARPSTQLLVGLATLADKYACQAALMPYGVLWLQRGLECHGSALALGEEGEMASLEDHCRMLLFAYVLDLPEQFARVSWEILLQHRQGFKDEVSVGFELPIPRDHELLRHDIHGELQRRKARLRRDVLCALMKPIAGLTAQMNNAGRPPCERAAAAMGHYLMLLERHWLGSWQGQFETDSFGAILGRMAAVGAAEQTNLLYDVDSCGRRGCSCLMFDARVNLAQGLREAVEGAGAWKLWLCLDCLRSGGEAYEKRRCRVEHW